MNSITTYKFSELYEMSSGISTEANQYGKGSPFLSFSNVFNNFFIPEILDEKMSSSKEEQETYSIKEGDLFLTRTSETIDELAMSSVALKDYPNATFSGFLKRLRPRRKDKVYPKFIAFYLRSEIFRKTMTLNAVLTLRASFNEEIFSYINLYLPKYEEQVKIGDFLYMIESKININNKINNKIEEITDLIYSYWFNNFEFPNKDGDPYLSAGGELKKVKKNNVQIPIGWDMENFNKNKLSEIIKPNINIFNGEKSYLQTGDIDDDKLLNFKNKITFKKRESRANMQPIKNSIWFAKMKNSKKHLYFGKYSSKRINQIILSTGMVGLKIKENSLEYFWKTIRSKQFEKIKDLLSHGATQQSVNNEDLNFLPIIIPDQITLNNFSAKTKNLFIKKYFNEEENKNLSELRDWLLPMLLNKQVNFSKNKVI